MSRFEKDFEEITARLKIDPEPNPEHRQQLRRQMLSVFESAGPSITEEPQKSFQKRRFRMNRLAKIAASILIVAGIVAAIVFLTQGPGSATIAWADVQARVRNIQTMTFKAVVRQQGVEGMRINAMIMEPGLIRQEIVIGPQKLKLTHIMDMRAGKILILTERDKTAVRINVPSLPEKVRQKFEDADMLAQFKEMIEGSENELGEREINGRLAKGYRVEKDNQIMNIWVDAQTAEPLEMQMEMYGPEVQLTISDFEFDKELDKSLFSFKVPPGYKEPMKSPLEIGDASTEDLADFFKFWAESRGGTFSDTLAESEWVKDCVEHMEALGKSIGEEEFVKRVTGFGRARLFLQIEQETQYHYAGQGVNLGDATKPIFWFKPKDSQTYKVIYGDLSIKELAEGDLPK